MIKLEPAKCPSCGANLEVNKELSETICQYCGTTVLIQDAIQKYKIEISGKIEIDGVATENSQLIRANQFFSVGKYDDANKLYKNILKIAPTNAEAWWGIYMCENAIANYYGYRNNLGDTSKEIKANILENLLNNYAYKAIEYANDELKEKYKNNIIETEEYIQKVRTGFFNKKTLKELLFKKKK